MGITDRMIRIAVQTLNFAGNECENQAIIVSVKHGNETQVNVINDDSLNTGLWGICGCVLLSWWRTL